MEELKNKISIVVIHHTGRLLDRCLYSLKDVNAQKIVVTTDDTWERKNAHQCLLLAPEFNNPCLKRNLGAKIAVNEYLIFLDDDVEVKEGCIENMVEYLEKHPETGMVYGNLFKMDNHSKIDTSGSYLTWCGFLWETYLPITSPMPILSAKSALCAIKRDLLAILYGFDENFVIYGEETDLSWRVWAKGLKVEILPQAVAYHAFETTLKPQNYYNRYFIHYHGCKNYITMLLKNLPLYMLWMVFINAFIWFVCGCGMWLKNRQAGRWIFQGIWYNFVYFKRIWKQRNKHAKTDFYKIVMRNPPLNYYINRFREYLIHQLHG